MIIIAKFKSVRVCNIVGLQKEADTQSKAPVHQLSSAYSGLTVCKPFDGRSNVNHLDHQVFISWNAIFNELEFPFKSLFGDKPAEEPITNSLVSLSLPVSISPDPNNVPVGQTQATAASLVPLNRPVLCQQTSSESHMPSSQLATFVPHHEQPSEDTASRHKMWYSAMQEEFKALQSNNTWSLVPYSSDMSIVGCKWVFRTKYKQDENHLKHKARFFYGTLEGRNSSADDSGEADVQPGRDYITLNKVDVEEHIFKHESVRMMIERAINDDIRLLIKDVDTNSYHKVKFRYYRGFAFIIHGLWHLNFTERRSLKVGDEIGFYGDSNPNILRFSVMNK
ncbi:hypothetical protein EZV62_010590 [Acer yangbiense]|uniref:TF-B3 domain-containing protein n=1 Tax=Acer yangbiense TaxID=1000413 RepID=A0A5C7I4V0_9ROSI|nr:hypothetical protein EZV62_010590 [Acer yangbiense]